MTRATDEHLAAWIAAQGFRVNAGARPTAAAPTPRRSSPNTANPLDSWKGLAHIPHLAHQEAVARLATSRAAFLTAVEAETTTGRSLSAARTALVNAVESVRDR